MTEKELKKDNPCGTGKVADEYLDGTICEPEEEVEDVTSLVNQILKSMKRRT